MIITKYIEKSRRNSVDGESSSGCNTEDLNRVKQQMTMEAITQGTAEHIMHHVMINFMLNGEMRFMQFDFTRESADTKNVFLFVEDYTVPQRQAFITTLRSIYCKTD
ncbi:hypothetical protein DWZ97_11680 [Firmicutes bacterium AF36-19BH]|nr:hypothetical protein DWZ97_11680 [Firmicutes bacterium AF36-19BH]